MPVIQTITQQKSSIIKDFHLCEDGTIAVLIQTVFLEGGEIVSSLEPVTEIISAIDTQRIYSAKADSSLSIYANVKLALYQELIRQERLIGEIV